MAEEPGTEEQEAEAPQMDPEVGNEDEDVDMTALAAAVHGTERWPGLHCRNSADCWSDSWVPENEAKVGDWTKTLKSNVFLKTVYQAQCSSKSFWPEQNPNSSEPGSGKSESAEAFRCW